MKPIIDLFCVLVLGMVLLAAVPVLLFSLALEDFEARKP